MKAASVTLVFLVVLCAVGCGGGGGGTPTVKPAILRVGSEANYVVTGTLSDGTDTYTAGGTVRDTLALTELLPVQGLNTWRINSHGNLTIDGEPIGEDIWRRYIAQDPTSGKWVYRGEESDNVPLILTTWSREPVFVPSPLASSGAWSWSATYSDGSPITANCTMTGPEQVSTPLGTFTTYRIRLDLVPPWGSFTDYWWMSPQVPLPVRRQIRYLVVVNGLGMLTGDLTLTLQSYTKMQK